MGRRQTQLHARSLGMVCLGSAGGMGSLPVLSRGSDKGVDKTPSCVRLSPSPASAPQQNVSGSLTEMMEEALAMVSPRTEGGQDATPPPEADEMMLPSIHGRQLTQMMRHLVVQEPFKNLES
mgnify:CR=1 FL=1